MGENTRVYARPRNVALLCIHSQCRVEQYAVREWDLGVVCPRAFAVEVCALILTLVEIFVRYLTNQTDFHLVWLLSL